VEKKKGRHKEIKKSKEVFEERRKIMLSCPCV
jgi:hypothetical protein